MTREKSPNSKNLNENVFLMLPNSLEESFQIANSNNIDLLISKLDYEIATKELDIEKVILAQL